MTVSRKKKPSGVLDNGTSCAAVVKKEELISQARERLSDLPDVRPDRVKKASLRAAQGFYDRPQVISKIADRFLQEMGIG